MAPGGTCWAVLGGFLVAELDRFRGVFQDFDSDASGDMSAGELGSASLGYCWGVFTSVYGKKWVKKHGKTSGIRPTFCCCSLIFSTMRFGVTKIFRTHDGPGFIVLRCLAPEVILAGISLHQRQGPEPVQGKRHEWQLDRVTAQ